MSETRKLQRIGGNTLYVSLPKRWTNRMQLKQGDKVTLTPQPDDSMSIHPTAKKERPREITLKIDVKDSKQSITREITAAYVDGFDIIKLKAQEKLTEKQQDIIRGIVDHLFGLEIIEVTGSMMVIECLLKQDLPIGKTIQRIHNVILSMLSEVVPALKKQDISLVKGLTRRMHDIKRLSLVTNRLLRSIIIFPSSAEVRQLSLIDCVDYLRILHIIAEIADNVNRISGNITALSEQVFPQSILELLCQACVPVRDLYDQSIRALLSGDISLANQVLDSELTFDNMRELCREADEKSEISSLTLSYAYLLIDNLKHIQQYAVEIAEIAIDRSEAAFMNGQNIRT